MGVVWCKKTNKSSSVSAKRGEKGADDFTAEDAYLVRTDSPDNDKMEIIGAPGISLGAPHPDVGGIICQEVTAKSNDDTGLLWLVTTSYSKYVPGEGDDGGGGGAELPYDKWTAGGSSKSIPVFRDRAGNLITNSAGDILEGLEKEQCEYTLNLVKAFAHHSGWMALAAATVDHVNSGTWQGGAEETWLCRFRNANLEVKVTEQSCMIYWSTQWEFAYRADTWRLMPWDVGFHEVFGGYDQTGNPQDGTGKRRTILGADGKAVKHPVALNGNGRPKAAGQPPDVVMGKDGKIGVPVYDLADFSPFGQIYTPNC